VLGAGGRGDNWGGELETLLSLSKNLGLIDTETFEELSEEQDEVSRLLYGLIRSLTKPRK
jgi:four helix bundle protein